MEVHHHPHVEKKNFKEYFLEFVMIFLAVTMGFFAENIREGIVNREAVTRNMETIVSNLKTDTIHLHEIIKFTKSRVRSLDSLDRFRNRDLTDTKTLKEFFLCIDTAMGFDFFRISKVAFDQMKSADGFRLVKQQNVVDSIFAYYDFNGVLDENTDYINYFQRQVFNLYHKLIEPDNLTETSRIVNGNRGSLIELFNTIATMNVGLKRFYARHLGMQLQNATRLIELLNRTYDLK